MAVTNEIVMADDSGLEIDALIKSQVFIVKILGEDTPYDIKNRYILDKLKDVEWDDRTARFVCAIACVFPDGRVITKEGAGTYWL